MNSSRRMAALLTITSILPYFCLVSCTSFAAAWGLLRSSTKAMVLGPSCSAAMAAAEGSGFSPVMLTPESATTTLAPSLAIRFAIASPIPVADPVTIATVPSRLLIALWYPVWLCLLRCKKHQRGSLLGAFLEAQTFELHLLPS